MEHSRLALAGFDMLLRSYSYGLDKTPFLKLTVKEFLWGYPSLIMSINTVRSCAAKVNTPASHDEQCLTFFLIFSQRIIEIYDLQFKSTKVQQHCILE